MMRSMHPAEDTNRRLKSDATTRYSEVFYKKKLSLVFWGVSGAGLPPFNSAVNTFSLCAA